MSRPLQSLIGAAVVALMAVAALLTAGAAGSRAGAGGAADAAPRPDAERYVALGDSYSSGTGAGSYRLDGACERSRHAYPYIVAQRRPATRLVFVACRGATTGSVRARQVAALTSRTRLVSITVGGNDVGFADVITACVTLGCSSARARAARLIRGQLPGRLDRLYKAIRRRAPAALVAVLGYPRLFGGSGCIGAIGISGSERRRLNAVADLLDATIAGRAAAHGFVYISAIQPFRRHAVCSGAAWLNGLELLDLSESFHPNRHGHRRAYAPLLLSAFDGR